MAECYDWEALFERIEQGMSTTNDADVVRDLHNKALDLEEELAKFTDDELFNVDEDGGD